MNSIADFFEIIGDYLSQLWYEIISVFTSFGISDVLDIIVIAILVYQGIKIIKQTRGGQLIKGIIFTVIIYFVSGWFSMEMLHLVLKGILDVGILVLIVLFQPELRRVLEQLGRTSGINILSGNIMQEEAENITKTAIDEVAKASMTMSNNKTGALIVFENKTMLNEIMNSGNDIDAKTSADLLCNLFYPKSPMHDGAVVIRDGRVHSAACILPLTQNVELSRELGTRHRASIGMSETTDAAVVVVSEETGTISLAHGGILTRGFDAITLKAALEEILLDDDERKNDKNKRKLFFQSVKYRKNTGKKNEKKLK